MDELVEVSKAVCKVFEEYAIRYPDRLRYYPEDKVLEWKDSGDNWNRVTDWDNY